MENLLPLATSLLQLSILTCALSATGMHLTYNPDSPALRLSPEAQQELNEKLLDIVAMTPDLEAIQSLLDQGADVNCYNPKTGHTPLTWAALNHDSDSIKILLSHGANLKHFKDTNRSLIHWLCSSEILSSLLTLLEYPVVLSESERILARETLEKESYSPLEAACIAGDSSCVTKLLQSVTHVDLSKPLQRATRYGHTSIIKALLDHGAFEGTRNSEGNTLLHIAALNGREEVVAFFIDKHMRCDIYNNEGNTAWGIARELNQRTVVKIFEQKVPSTVISTVSKAAYTNKLDQILPLLSEPNIMRQIIGYLMGAKPQSITSYRGT
jgi:ankyrin repeat protein